MKKICVLMAVYNPTEYIDEQVKSIFDQQNVEVDLVIRDDSSINKEWLNIIQESYPQVTIIKGEKNLGVIGNVWELVKYAAKNRSNYEYYAYSDQDDVWMPNKLITGIETLDKMDDEKPNLYYSNLLLTDKDLNPQKELFPRSVVNNTIGQSMAHIFEFACTSIFNNRMLQELNAIPKEFMQFDHLIYYMSIIKGTAYFDDEPHIYYRQHGNNVSGSKEYDLHYYISKLSVIREDSTKTVSYKRIAKYIMKYFKEDMDESKREIVNKVATYDSFYSRIKIIFDKRIRAGYQPRDFYRVLRLLIGKY